MSNSSSRESSPLNPALLLAAGAAAGVIVGVLLADRFGGSRALMKRLSGLFKVVEASGDDDEPEAEDEYDEYGAEIVDDEELDDAPDLDARVLAAFEQDPILADRAIEIDTDEPGMIVLRGAVPSAEDAAHAVTIARGTPGVTKVENLLRVRTPRSRTPTAPGPRR